jgi:hypothetical protein
VGETTNDLEQLADAQKPHLHLDWISHSPERFISWPEPCRFIHATLHRYTSRKLGQLAFPVPSLLAITDRRNSASCGLSVLVNHHNPGLQSICMHSILPRVREQDSLKKVSNRAPRGRPCPLSCARSVSWCVTWHAHVVSIALLLVPRDNSLHILDQQKVAARAVASNFFGLQL